MRTLPDFPLSGARDEISSISYGFPRYRFICALLTTSKKKRKVRVILGNVNIVEMLDPIVGGFRYSKNDAN